MPRSSNSDFATGQALLERFEDFGSVSLDFTVYMGGCQNYGHVMGTLNIRCRIIIRTQKGTIILTTNHMFQGFGMFVFGV